MWITRIELRNWMSFKGEHLLNLEPKAYAVSARREDDPDSSNWAGKSAFAESILFALTGWLNPSRRFDNADGWIHRGEKEGGVSLTFNDGSVIDRSRKRGKSTQLEYTFGAGSLAKQDEAQKLIDERVGLKESDLLATSFCVQREAAFLVRAAGADLDDVFGAWLRLEKLEKAQERLEKAAQSAKEEAELSSSELQRTEAVWKDYIHVPIAQLVSTEDESSRAIPVLEQRISLARRLLSAKEKVAEFDKLGDEGSRLRAEYDVMDHAGRKAHYAKAEKDWAAKSAAKGEAEKELRRAEALAKGEFDGVCPVGKMQCPVSAEIVAKRARNKTNANLASVEWQKAVVVETDAFAGFSFAKAKLQEAERLAERLQTMRDRAEKLFDQIDHGAPEPEDIGSLEMQLASVRGAYLRARDARVIAQSSGQQAEKAQVLVTGLKLRLAAAREREGILSAAALVVRHTRKKITQSVLGDIQDAANNDLADCGVPLTIQLRWEREGRGLAKHCDKCGRPFPDSTKIKACICGTVRGPMMVSRLDCQLSDRSGGAEDLAGVVLQLAASRWLKEERRSEDLLHQV